MGASFGPDALQLPVGTDTDRPASPPLGYMRYNTDQYGVEMYTQAGWKVAGGELGSIGNPANNGIEIYNDGQTTSGTYWLKTPAGVSYQAYIRMDHGGGWVRINRTLGPYTTALSGGSVQSGGGDFTSGAADDGISALNGPYVSQTQASIYGCYDSAYSYVSVNSTLWSDLGASDILINWGADGHSGVVCGRNLAPSGTMTVTIGGANDVNVCANTPNRWSDVNPQTLTSEQYYTGVDTADIGTIWKSWTACGGGYMNIRINDFYIR